MPQSAPIDCAPGWRARRTSRANALYRRLLAAVTFVEGFGLTVIWPEEEDERLRDVSEHLRATPTIH